MLQIYAKILATTSPSCRCDLQLVMAECEGKGTESSLSLLIMKRGALLLSNLSYCGTEAKGLSSFLL